MQQQLQLRLLPRDAADDVLIRKEIANQTGLAANRITGYYIVKRSLDARGKQAWVHLTIQAFVDEPAQQRPMAHFNWRQVHQAVHRVIIVGAGPAGLFAALQLIECGIQPVIIERGKDVRSRRRDLALLNKEGIINPNSNYCFGEGGAGTYSDGKLYTRSNKRGDVNRILQLFHLFGADEQILYQSHPHIGTNKLPHIITAMRQHILDCGGEIHFETRFTGLIINKGRLSGIEVQDGQQLSADAVILCTGHSARDVFETLHHAGVEIEAKPFALGVRVEHPQALIDAVQYRCAVRDPLLPPASYSLVEQVQGKGVFSFCMCPGGIIAPAATAPGELVVNGWSPSRRNNPYANSGMVVTVSEADALRYFKQTGRLQPHMEQHPLLLMWFQQAIEQQAYAAGGGSQVAPALRMTDFCNRKLSASLPQCSYVPGVQAAELDQVLPDFVYEDLQLGFRAFDRKMKGYLSAEAIVVATESRTSSPVRIPRNPNTLQHPQLAGLFPCGEGAGYAGGIVSAAMDGERVARTIYEQLVRP